MDQTMLLHQSLSKSMFQFIDRLFHPDRIHRLIDRSASPPDRSRSFGHFVADDSVDFTRRVAVDFLCRGGKYFRPLISLAAYQAMIGDEMPLGKADSKEHFPDAVIRASVSIEAFHKASLVHDDIQDDDEFRYGELTLHRRYGIPTAINIGDYLIGLGYQLVSRDASTLGGDTVADILDCLSSAHLRLSEGQGAELHWRDHRNRNLSVEEAIRIYSLKTSPAFEAALFMGMRLASETKEYRSLVRDFADAIGIAFQILNDLGDWEADALNKKLAACDVLGGRPTLLLALAMEAFEVSDQKVLLGLVDGSIPCSSEDRIQRVRKLMMEAGVFESAQRRIDFYRERAETLIGALSHNPLRQLLGQLIDTILMESPRAATSVVHDSCCLVQVPRLPHSA